MTQTMQMDFGSFQLLKILLVFPRNELRLLIAPTEYLFAILFFSHQSIEAKQARFRGQGAFSDPIKKLQIMIIFAFVFVEVRGLCLLYQMIIE